MRRLGLKYRLANHSTVCDTTPRIIIQTEQEHESLYPYLARCALAANCLLQNQIKIKSGQIGETYV